MMQVPATDSPHAAILRKLAIRALQEECVASSINIVRVFRSTAMESVS